MLYCLIKKTEVETAIRNGQSWISSSFLHILMHSIRYSGQALGECVVNETNCEPTFVLSGCFPTTPCDFPAIDSCQYDVTDCPTGQMLSGTSCQVKCKSPYMTPLGEAHGSIECRDPNIDPKGAIWTPPSCILGCSEPSSQTGYRNVLGEWQCADGYDGPGWEHMQKKNLQFSLKEPRPDALITTNQLFSFSMLFQYFERFACTVPVFFP